MRLAAEADFSISSLKTVQPDKLLETTRRGRANWHNYETLKEFVEEDLGLFERIEPDLVLNDMRLSVPTACKAANMPLAAILNASWTNYYTIKVRGVENSRIGEFIRRTIGRKLARRLGLAEKVKQLILIRDSSCIRKLRKEMRLPSCKNLWEAMQGDLNLLCDIPEYAPTNDLPSHFSYIGPVTWEPEEKLPAWLNQLSPDRPTLYFTMGSTGNPGFFREAIDVFGDTKYQCLMTTGGMANIHQPPKNCFIADHAPGSAVAGKSNVVICHGGNGTIYQAMSQGVPIIGIPTMHDQEFNMQRVVDLGIGIQLNQLKWNRSDLIEAVEEVLAEKHYKTNAEEFKAILANYRGSRKGAELINGFCQQRLPRA